MKFQGVTNFHTHKSKELEPSPRENYTDRIDRDKANGKRAVAGN